MSRDKIFIQGYGFSGSSLIRDFLYEYNNVAHFNNIEFNLCRSSGGLFELGLLIENAWFWSLDSFIHRFYRLIDFLYENSYKNILGENFLKYSYEFIDKIILYRVKTPYLQFTPNEILKRPWLTLDKTNKDLKYYIKKYANKFFVNDFIDSFMGELNKLNHFENIYTCKRLSLEEYLAVAREYLNKIFDLFPEDKKIVMVHPCNIISSKIDTNLPYFDGKYKVIIVDKDPRDIFVAMKNRYKKKPGTYLDYYSNIDNFIEDFKYSRRFHEHNLKVLGGKVLYVTCEDFIQNYDFVSGKIENFLNLESDLHSNKFKFFNPEISIKNVEMYKKYENKEDIKKIEDNLSAYLKY